MPGKRAANMAAALIALSSVVVGVQEQGAVDAEQETFVEILACPPRLDHRLPMTEPNVNGGCC